MAWYVTVGDITIVVPGALDGLTVDCVEEETGGTRTAMPLF